MSLKELVAMSNKYGADPEFVLAGGGNTSWKNDKDLYVKGSGTSLADIDENGFVRMDRAKLNTMWSRKYSNIVVKAEKQVLADIMAARGEGELQKRPSVEVLLHELFPQNFVLHVHPASVNGITCGQNGEEIVKSLFGTKALWVPCTNPGYTLAAAAKSIINGYIECTGTAPGIMFLENHGVFFADDTISGLDALVGRVMGEISNRITKLPDFSDIEFDSVRAAMIAPAIRMLLKSDGSSIVTFRTNKEVKGLTASSQAFIPLLLTFTPDHIVYCKHEPLFIEKCDDINEQYSAIEKGVKEFEIRSGHKPKIVAVEGLGIFAWGKTKKEADIAAAVFMDAVKIAIYSESFGGPKFMNDDAVAFIRNWEAETYRQKISLGSGTQKRAAEKIAIVTGAAQGFGKGIADGLANEGANIVVADLNETGASETALEFERRYGKGRAVATRANVAEEDSVWRMVVHTVLEYGGLDIFISNAGVVKSGSLEEMDANSFEFVTKVNYTGFFLGAKYASRIMKIQNLFDKNYYMDIIQINSKSGLAGSNKNFAYAGSKFGGIGLTQSFAMELVEYNIKVNAVCPGNFFEGPLWSDPVKGLFVQYLNAGKVSGAKSVEDVKRAYESKVPMGRGCREKDVVRAILYIIEQEYETGQAVPVTGGQQMLK